MKEKQAFPQTLAQAIRYFADLNNCIDFLANLRWPDGVTCPKCGSKEVSYVSTRRIWKCKQEHDHRQFSAKVGTIMEDSPIPLDKWLTAMWMLSNCRNGISSYEVARDLGVTQNSAWFMLHRIRKAMQNGSFQKFGGPGGEVEADEAFIGGKPKNMHANRRLALRKARESSLHGDTRLIGKTAIMGVLDRDQREVRATVVRGVNPETLQSAILSHVEHGSSIYTDEATIYKALPKDRYLDEQMFRYNNRKDDDGNKLSDAERFKLAASQIVGKRLTYAEVTGKVGETATF